MLSITRIKQYGERFKRSFFTFFDILKLEKLKIEDSFRAVIIQGFGSAIDFKTNPTRN